MDYVVGSLWRSGSGHRWRIESVDRWTVGLACIDDGRRASLELDLVPQFLKPL